MDGGYIKIYKISISTGLVCSMQNKGIRGLFGTYLFIFYPQCKICAMRLTERHKGIPELPFNYHYQ